MWHFYHLAVRAPRVLMCMCGEICHHSVFTVSKIMCMYVNDVFQCAHVCLPCVAAQSAPGLWTGRVGSGTGKRIEVQDGSAGGSDTGLIHVFGTARTGTGNARNTRVGKAGNRILDTFFTKHEQDWEKLRCSKLHHING
jgi:hypothetical protein